jgi:hypothetical protein
LFFGFVPPQLPGPETHEKFSWNRDESWLEPCFPGGLSVSSCTEPSRWMAGLSYLAAMKSPSLDFGHER